MPKEVEHYFTVKEVTDLLKITRRTLLAWTDAGKIIPTEMPADGAFGKTGIRYSATAIHDCFKERRPKLSDRIDALAKGVMEIETLLALFYEDAALDDKQKQKILRMKNIVEEALKNAYGDETNWPHEYGFVQDD